MQTNTQTIHSADSGLQVQSYANTITQANPGKKNFCSLYIVCNHEPASSLCCYNPSAVPQVPQRKSVPTLKLLQKELYKIADKWEDIGIQLDVDMDLLEKVKSDNDSDSKKCLREMLKILVKKEDLQPSWTDVIEALECLEEEELAQQLKDKYC